MEEASTGGEGMITLAGSFGLGGGDGGVGGGASSSSPCASPTRSSPPPSPLALSISDCGSPGPMSPTPHVDEQHSNLLSCPPSVLTHEGCDPMLSASPSNPPATPTTTTPGAAAIIQPFSPPEQLPSIFGRSETFPKEKQQQQHLRLSTASSTDSQQSLNASAQGYDRVAVAASQLESRSSPFPVSTAHSEPPRKDQITLLGCHALTLNVPKSDGKIYVAHVFDRGTYFSAGIDADPDLLAHLRTPRGTKVDVVYSKIDPNRASFDHVSIQFNTDVSQEPRWTTLPKPGTAMQAIQMAGEAKSFFLQVTAAVKIDAFFSACFGAKWILAAKSVVNVVNSTLASNNADLAHFSSKVIKNLGSPPSYSEAIKSNSETLHLSTGTLTLHADRGRVNPTGLLQTDRGRVVPSTANGGLAHFAATQINGRQYEALDQGQAAQCVACPVCNKRFKYVMEHLLHFTLGTECRDFVLSSARHHARATSQPPRSSFFALLADLIRRKCGLDDGTRLVCDRCLSVTAGPVEYAMHRDMHRPAVGDLFPCQFCGLLFRTPHGFYRHTCVKHWNVAETIRSAASKASASKSSQSEDAFKIYSGLSEEEKSKLTRCPICQKQSAYMSGFVSHLRSSPQCLNGLAHAHKSTFEVINLPRIMMPQQSGDEKPEISVRTVKCEECGLKAANQVAYAAHKDHHCLRKQGMLICKGCDSEYKTPCEFYRHICSAGANNANVTPATNLHWCPFCDVCRRFDEKKGEAGGTKATDPDKQESNNNNNNSLQQSHGSKGMALKTVFGRRKSSDSGKPTSPPKSKLTARKSTSGQPSRKRKKFEDESVYICRGCSPRKILKGSGDAARHRCLKTPTTRGRGAMPERLSKYNRFKIAVPNVGICEDDGSNCADLVRRELARLRGDKEEGANFQSGVFCSVLRSEAR